MPRNKLNRELEKLAREKGLLSRLDSTKVKVVVIPCPPSVNNLYISRGRNRVKSPEYRNWIEKAEPAMRGLITPERYPVRFVLTVLEKVKRSRDVDNFAKATLDLAKRAGVIDDDNLLRVTGLAILYRPVSEGAGVQVSWEYDE